MIAREKKMKERLVVLVRDISFVWKFAMDDFKKKYAGSALGIIWAFLQPIITMVLYWFVFELGFRSQPIEDFPFILWLMAGLVSWFFISDAIVNATSALADYRYLVKQVQFNINILPLAKIISALLVQVVLIVFVCICFWNLVFFILIHLTHLPYLKFPYFKFLVLVDFCP